MAYYRGDDDWSNDSFDDYSRREIYRRVGRNHSRRGRRSPNDEPQINIIENRLYVPGDEERRGSSRSRSRRRSRSSSSELHRLEDQIHRLTMASDHHRIDEGRSRHEEDIRRRIDLEMREEKFKEEDRRQRLEWAVESERRKEEKRKEEIELELQEVKRKRDEAAAKALRDAEAKKQQEADDRKRIAAEIKAEEEAKAKKAKEEKERIMLEAEFEKKDKEAKDKALKEKILAEVAAEKVKEEEKKKKEDEAFEARLREQAIKAGLDPDRAVQTFKQKDKREGGQVIPYRSPGGYARRIKVYKDHILPQTLDSYNLRWNYDDGDANLIVIEDEIDNNFLWELQEDSARIIKSRKLITPGYTKKTTTTLTPNGTTTSIRKKNGKLYTVRKTSRSRSRSRSRHISDFY